MNYTTDTLFRYVFGIDSNSFNRPKSKVRQMISKFSDLSVLQTFFFIVDLLPFLRNNYAYTLMPPEVSAFFTSITERAIKLQPKNCCLEHIVKVKEAKSLASVDVVALCLNLFIDGFDTSNVAIAHALYRLASNPECQSRLRMEIRESKRKNGGQVTYDSIGEMNYLEQVFNGKSAAILCRCIISIS